MPSARVIFYLRGALLSVLLCAVISVSRGLAKDRALNRDNGRQVFYEHCAACHNKLEKVASYLVDDTAYFVNAGVPAEAAGSLYRRPVRTRPPGSRMPAYSPEEISDVDLDDLGFYLASATAPPKRVPALGSAERGAPLYAKFCASCHGAKGEGVGKMLPVAVFANQLKQGGAPPSVILGFVMLSARSGSVPNMPTYAEKLLSDRDLEDIAGYIWAMPMPPMPSEH